MAQIQLSEAHAILRDAPNASVEDREEALIALAELYEARHAADPDGGHEVQAAEWRAKLAELQAATQATAAEN